MFAYYELFQVALDNIYPAGTGGDKVRDNRG
jgi:hypothetical protein